jgi:hypothetical protein
MDKDLIERLAREAGGRLESWMTNPPKPAHWHLTPEAMECFGALVAEECAKACDQEAEDWTGYERGAVQHAAEAIRAKFKGRT